MLKSLSEILESAVTYSGADFGNLQIIDKDGSLKIVLEQNFSDRWLDFWELLTFGQLSTGEALESYSRMLIPNMRKCPSFTTEDQPSEGTLLFSKKGHLVGVINRDYDAGKKVRPNHFISIEGSGMESLLSEDIQAMQCTPIVSRDGNMLGLLNVYYSKATAFKPNHFFAIDILVKHAANLLEFRKENDHAQYEIKEKDGYIRYLENKGQRVLPCKLFAKAYV